MFFVQLMKSQCFLKVEAPWFSLAPPPLHPEYPTIHANSP